jgi:hypothetical protein
LSPKRLHKPDKLIVRDLFEKIVNFQTKNLQNEMKTYESRVAELSDKHGGLENNLQTQEALNKVKPLKLLKQTQKTSFKFFINNLGFRKLQTNSGRASRADQVESRRFGKTIGWVVLGQRAHRASNQREKQRAQQLEATVGWKDKSDQWAQVKQWWSRK